MASKCFMCGREISKGILCDKCDKPRKSKTASPSVEPSPKAPPRADSSSPSSPPRTGPPTGPPRSAASPAVQVESFPKAPILPFPVESASPAITSVVNLLVTAGVASVLIGPDKHVKFVSDEAMTLFEAPQNDLSNIKYIEARTGVRIGDLSVPTSAGIRLNELNILYSLVPLSGGASGAVLIFRRADPMNETHASFVTYVQETVFEPLRALRESLLAAARQRGAEPLLVDSAATVDQILSSLELAPAVDERTSGARPVPTVTDVVSRVADRFVPFADLKGIELQVDVQELDERFRAYDQLAESLAILMDNALHYVPAGGQVVIGVRWMEHKGKPLLLFFVMDNGPLVPEAFRTAIFEPGFVWHPSAPERTGRGLFKVREFALAHAGSVWVESKTGKACTFFLRVRPDGARS